jgi:hypothetical protein
VQREAAARYPRGVAQADSGDFLGALAQFEEAYRLAPRYQVLYNIAVAAEHLQRFGEAIAAYERYLGDGGGEVPADRQAEVNRALAELRAKVAEVTVVVPGAPAQLSLDGLAVGSSPLPGPLLVAGGHHTIVAERGRKTVEERAFEVTPGPGHEQTLTLGAPERKAPPVDEGDERLPPPRVAPLPPPMPALALLHVRTDPSGAHLRLDGREAGFSPWSAQVAAAPHTVEATLGGRAPATRELTLVPGEERTLDLQLARKRPLYKSVGLWVGVAAAVVVIAAIAIGVGVYEANQPYATIHYPPL